MNREDVKGAAERHGFVLQDSRAIVEIDGTAHVMSHRDTGARLLWLDNPDNDKGFSISFKTPASDDTGVFHILEHSVLCGSEKYPVKEPFVNLLKTSMQTFLNAMTFPDKTMYPVASTNERDLMNLADVYMDAVFHPNIYKNPRIFEQEGWHYEVEDGSVVVNGVVFNEMKGALSDSESVLFDTLSAALFPDTTYRFESGGTPEAIPTLTYEQFLETHARHYRADNSYIVLYGNLNIEDFLGFLDARLSSAPSSNDVSEIGIQAPVINTGIRRDMVTTPDNSCAAYGYVVGTVSDRERIVATNIVLDAIMGSNVSPLKRALLEADIADDVDVMLSDSTLQPFAMIHAKGLHDRAVEKLGETIQSTIKKLADGSLDSGIVEAALSHAEFVMREGNFGYSDGVVYSMASLNGWLYDDSPEAATAFIRYEDVFASLREKLQTDYYRNLLREIFLNNTHWAQVEIVPVEEMDDPLKDRIAALEEHLDASQMEDIIHNADSLHDAQMAPDDPANLAKLPQLRRSDIGDAPYEAPMSIMREGEIEVLRHNIETHGIVYATRYFDLGRISFEELPYAKILAAALGKMDTASHTAEEIDTLQLRLLGSLGFGIDVIDRPGEDKAYVPKFTVATSALAQNASHAANIANEILTTSNFHAPSKLKDILTQNKVALEQKFAMAGNTVAAARAASYYLPSGVVREAVMGIDFYLFLKNLLKDFDEKAEELAFKLEDLASRLFTDDGCVLSFAGDDEAYKRYFADAPLGITASGNGGGTALEVPSLKLGNEAFIVPADITYTAVGADLRNIADAPLFNGAWSLASRILTFDYLWNEVRVVGGAYGVNFNVSRPGPAVFTSFRDPRVDETIRRFDDAGRWLSDFEPSSDELDGYVVSTTASFDKPLKPRDLVRRQASMHFADYSREEYLRVRQQVIDANLGEVRSLSSAITSIGSADNICVVGNREIIESARTPLNVIDLLAL